MRGSRWWVLVLLVVPWLLVGTDCKNRPLRVTEIVSFEVSPNPVVLGGSVLVAWQAESVGVSGGRPYCTLQRTFEGGPAEDPEVVDCAGNRTDEIDASITATYVNYRFSALRRSGEAYETADVRLDIVRVGVTVMPASVTLEPGGSQAFTATVTGVGDTGVTWGASCGSIAGGGGTVTYTAPVSVPDPPTCLVTATSQADANASASAVVTVEAGPEVRVSLEPADITLEPLSSHAFTATVTGTGDTRVNWAASCGSISGSGSIVTYTAPASVPDPPTCQVTATSQEDPSASASAVVTVAHGAGALIWTRQFGSDGDEYVRGVAVDGAGNVVVAGSTDGSLEGVNAGRSDAFVRKYDAAGSVLWTRQFGTGSYDHASGVAVDGLANVVVVGTASGPLDGVGGFGSDAFVRKYDAAGSVLWTRRFESGSNDPVVDVAVDALGNVVVAGYTWGSLVGENLGGCDAFVRKYDAAGAVLWTRQFGTGDNDLAWGVAVDGAGNVVVVGETLGSLAAVNAGGFDPFVRKYDAAGTVLWTRQFGTGEYDYAEGVAVDASGSVVVAGATGGSLVGVNAGGMDAFVRKYDAAGAVLWTRQFGTGEYDYAWGVAVDGSGNVIVAGETDGSLEGVSAGGRDAFVRKYDATGSVLWTRQFGTAEYDHARGVAVDGSGGVVVVGETHGSLEGVNAGGRDAFVRKYAP